MSMTLTPALWGWAALMALVATILAFVGGMWLGTRRLPVTWIVSGREVTVHGMRGNPWSGSVSKSLVLTGDSTIVVTSGRAINWFGWQPTSTIVVAGAGGGLRVPFMEEPLVELLDQLRSAIPSN